MIWVAGILTAFWVLAGLLSRSRAGRLVKLPRADRPASGHHRFLVRGGVELDEATRRTASAYADAAGLQVLDLIPGDFSATELIEFLDGYSPSSYRMDRLAIGRTAAHAMLVSEEVLERVGEPARRFEGGGPDDPAAFIAMAIKLKSHATAETSVAIAPDLGAVPRRLSQRKESLAASHGMGNQSLLIARAVVYALVIWCLWARPMWGMIAVAAMHLQPLLAFAGTDRGQKGLLRLVVFRFAIELIDWFWVISRSSITPANLELVEELRPKYVELLGDGPHTLLEPRRETCPICDAPDLKKWLTSKDVFQNKPGRFRLDRCLSCGHIFQNPRLTIKGLDYYYGDFYEGLGETMIGVIFACSSREYHRRAGMLEGMDARPDRWLDVGGGHGHFCLVARDIWTETSFELLDMSESVEEALAKGWCHRAWRGLFPEHAEELQASFDVVSMSHYLEHTIDPELEIATAARVLKDGGLLMIEVPNPDSPVGRLLGRAWLPWFQPQHLHFVGMAAMAKMLERHGLEPVLWHRSKAHQVADFLGLVLMFLLRLAPQIDCPWRPKPSWFRRCFNVFVWMIGIVMFIFAWFLDRLMVPFVKPLGISNAYRVLARREARSGA
ncbi:MAG: class I SAM-dependent methyltransferase [Planctomycetota bacterium]|nr:class I SAM-dependent methyltransferase [Planctomycetota bacterium]